MARIRSNYGHGCKGIYDGDKDKVVNAIYHGTPLDSNSEKAEVQAYFDGEAYGWEQGRKALIDEVKAEIEKLDEGITSYHNDKPWVYKSEVLEILDNIGKGE